MCLLCLWYALFQEVCRRRSVLAVFYATLWQVRIGSMAYLQHVYCRTFLGGKLIRWTPGYWRCFWAWFLVVRLEPAATF